MTGAMRFFLVIVLAIGAGFGAPARAAGLDEIAAGQGLSSAQVGFVLIDVQSGRVLAEHQGDRLAVPASVAKLPTAIAAVVALGSEHRFVTEVALAGTTLVLTGGGDPLLTPEDLRPAIARLKEMGTRVERFIYDASLWPQTPAIDPLQPDASAYNPGIGALAMDFNRVSLEWKANGRETSAHAISDKFRLDADAVRVLASPEPSPYRLRADGPDRWLVSNLSDTGRTWVPVKRPALNAAMVVRRLAEREGLSLPVPVEGQRPRDARPIYIHPSLPVAELVKRTLEHSNNMAAEMLGLATGMQVGESRPGSLAGSVSVVDGWLAAQFPEIDWTGYRRANHSGLSPDSRMTPRQMAGLVRHASLRIPGLLELLPRRELADAEPKAETKSKAKKAGAKAKDDAEAKTKPKAAKEQEAAKVVLRYRAKTGTMAYARGLVGILTPKSGRELAFAIFVYDDARRVAFDAALDRHQPVMPAEATAWIRRARNVERGLMREWTIAY